MSERHGRLFELAADAIFTVDERGHFTSVNLIMERAMGRRRGEMIGAHAFTLLDPSQHDAATKAFEGTLCGKRQHSELSFRDVAGRVRIGSISCTPIVEQGRVTGALCIVRDVTQDRRYADEVRQREKLAALGQLVSGVAHELNNPLAGITAFAQLLEETGQLSPEQQDAVDTIHTEAKRAAKIVSSLLLFSRQRQPERTIVDLNQVISDTVSLRRYVLMTRQIAIELALDPQLPKTLADASQLQQVFLNLLLNAEQALQEKRGKRKITIKTQRRGDRIVATVSDDGPGIPADKLPRIFEPFFTTKPVGEGTGMGLSISHGIVRQHKGMLRAWSTAGEGATFELELPSADMDDEELTAVTPESTEIPRHRRFLIVEREPAMREALALHLRRSGSYADAVSDGEQALELLTTQKYGAIFLDLRLSDRNGEELFEELAAHDADHAGRVIFAAGDLDSSAARQFLQAAGRPFVGKPFALSTVAAMLSQTATR